MVYESSQFEFARVVALFPGDPYDYDHPWPELAGGFDCVFVASPYEAAAEILCGGVAALVVDLNLMARRHGDLLDIARQANVSVLGSGAIPAGLSSEDLKGIRLVDREGLLAELQRAIATRSVADEEPAPIQQESSLEPMDDAEATSPPVEQEPPPPPHQTIEVPGQPAQPTRWADEPLLEAARQFLQPRGVEVDAIVNVGANSKTPPPPADQTPPKPPVTPSRPTGWASLLDDEA